MSKSLRGLKKYPSATEMKPVTHTQLASPNSPDIRRRSDHVFFIDDDIVELVRRMGTMLIFHVGVAIAAPQIGVNKRVILLNENVQVIINPIIETSGTLITGEEMCLSLPFRMFEVERWSDCCVSGVDLDGNRLEFEKSGWDARVLQHEIDHLDGLLIDRFPEIELGKSATSIKAM